MTADALEYQVPSVKNFAGLPVYGFKDTAWCRATIRVAPDLSASVNAIDLVAEVEWLVCEKLQCIPGRATVKGRVEVGDENRRAGKVAAVLAKAGKEFPAPLPITWRVAVDGKVLRVDAPDATPLADGETLFFYPDEAGWMAPALKQENDGCVVKLPEITGEV